MEDLGVSNKLKALIADDEPFYQEWLVDYLKTRHVEVDFAVNIESAIEQLTAHEYRFIIVDLSIPLNDKYLGTLRAFDSAIEEYPGLFIAHFARNNGYRTRQVIVYSVHVSEIIQAYVNKLYCRYIPKGRPGLLKAEIEEILSFDPTEEAGCYQVDAE
jgi:CheY-like chemotaxis protein